MSASAGRGGWRPLGTQHGPGELSHGMDGAIKSRRAVLSQCVHLSWLKTAIPLWFSLPLPPCLVASAARFNSQLKASFCSSL